MGELEISKIEEVLDERVRPNLAQHGGNIEIEKLEDGVLHVRMHGQCSGCPSAELTLENIMVTADTAVPFCPDFFPAILYGGKPLVAVYSIVEEYEITGNVLLFRTFAS